MRVLTAVDSKDMAAIHADSFDRGWDALAMATHTQKDLCLGVDYDGRGLLSCLSLRGRQRY